MAGLLDAVKKAIIYKKPADVEGFELLEDDRETEYITGKDSSGISTSSNNFYRKASEAAKENRVPLSPDKWNEAKKQTLPHPSAVQNSEVCKDIIVNLERITKEFNIPINADILTRQFKIARKVDAFVAFVDGMADKAVINNLIIRQLMMPDHFNDFNFEEGCPADYIISNVLSVNQISKETTYTRIIEQMLNGVTALFISNCDQCILIESRGFEKRNINTPLTENVVRGSQEGFTENLRTNITQIRRGIRNKNLITEMVSIGKNNITGSAIMYINGIVNPRIVKEVKRRINSINIDYIAANGILEQLIEDKPFDILPQTVMTERPDRAISFLMEGRIAVISEGAPFALIVPVTFWDLMHTTEDSNLKWQYGTFIRFVRVFGLVVAASLPALYIGITLYHQEMIPTELLTAIAQSREKVPFPLVIEVLLMEISFELIREGGIRVPGVIGNTLGIVGALILGQAAVQAGIVSPILVIVVSVTGLGNFTIPNYSMTFAIRIVRFLFVFLAAVAGFYGISAGFFILIVLGAHLKSFGVPYFTPIAPKGKTSPGIIFRQPVYNQQERPDELQTLNRRRMGKVKPGWVGKNGERPENDDT